MREIAEGMEDILKGRFHGNMNDFLGYWVKDKAVFVAGKFGSGPTDGQARPKTPDRSVPEQRVQEQKAAESKEGSSSWTEFKGSYSWGQSSGWEGWADYSQTEGGSSGSGWKESPWPAVPVQAGEPQGKLEEPKGKRKAVDLALDVETKELLGLLSGFTDEERTLLKNKSRFTRQVLRARRRRRQTSCLSSSTQE